MRAEYQISGTMVHISLYHHIITEGVHCAMLIKWSSGSVCIPEFYSGRWLFQNLNVAFYHVGIKYVWKCLEMSGILRENDQIAFKQSYQP